MRLHALKKLVGFCVCLFSLHAFAIAQSASNLGYTLTLDQVETRSEFADVSLPNEEQWVVLHCTFRNEIDPFLVFDFGIDEDINILRMQDRAFLQSASGRVFRISEDHLGRSGHFRQNLKLERNGSEVSGILAFRVPKTEIENSGMDLHFLDEYYEAIEVPVNGGSGFALDTSSLTTQQNSAVELAVGKHGFKDEIRGQKAREGFCYAQAQKGLVFLTEGLEAVGE